MNLPKKTELLVQKTCLRHLCCSENKTIMWSRYSQKRLLSVLCPAGVTLRYGIAIWGGTSSTNLGRILIQQKRAIRCLLGLQWYEESFWEVFQRLKPITTVSLYSRAVILHTVNTQQTRHLEHNTRRSLNFVSPLHHWTIFTKKPSYKGVVFYSYPREHLKINHNRSARTNSPYDFKTAHSTLKQNSSAAEIALTVTPHQRN